MRWQQFRESENVEDGGGRGFPGGMQGAGGLGLGTIVILGLIGWALGIDPSVLIGGAEVLNGGAPASQQGSGVEPNDELKHFVSAILGDTEDRWSEIFKQNGQ